MKLSLALAGLSLAVCALVCAQDSGNRVVVPGKNGSHARTVEANLISGTIVVKTGSGNDVVVEAQPSHGRSSTPDSRTPPGMHRIDVPWNAPLHVEESDDVIHVNVSPHLLDGALNITVPVNMSLRLHAVHGPIRVDGVHGEIDAESTHGDITLTNVAGTVVANAVHGSLKVTMSQVDQSKPLSFSTMNGEIDVSLPADVKANLKMRALRGEIWSDFEVRLAGRSTLARTGASVMNGAINGGGVDITFYTVNGKITIHKR